MPESMLTREELLAQLSAQSFEVSYRTLRYYSSLGLIPNPALQKGADGRSRGYYPESTVDVAAMIMLMQARGLNLQQIKDALQHIRTQSDHAAGAIAEWRKQMAETGSLPLLYELLPQLGEDLRRHLVEMLRLAGLPPIANSLQQVRLSVVTQNGETANRLLLIPHGAVQVSQLNFWELPELTDLLSRTSNDERRRTLIQVRTWLQGRNDWALESFWLVRCQRRPVGCLGLQRPWPLRLQSAGLIYGPLVEPEYAALGIAETLLSQVRTRAQALGLGSLRIAVDEGSLAGGSWLPSDFQAIGQGRDCLISTVQGKYTGNASIQPLQVNLLRVLFPNQPPILLTQASTDGTTPGWVLQDNDGVPVAAAWLSLADQEILIHYPGSWAAHEVGLAALLETAKSAARAKGLFHLRVWLPLDAKPTGIVEQQEKTLYRLDLQNSEPGLN